jgi:hypothetical protein
MRRGQIAKFVGLLAILVACATSIAAAPAPDEGAGPVAGRVGLHEGVASCAGSTCHSRPVASGLTVRQNELITWEGPGDLGAHSRAWKVLNTPRGQAIADRLGLGPAGRAQACLGCHADPAPAGQRGARFQLSDGVGCEACHGGAGGWIASHYAVGASHAGNVSRGMVALDDAKVRAAKCLDCHFGGSRPGQFTTHEIMAAGHPRIAFELDLYTSLQRHYDIDADFVKRKSWPSGVKVWAVGQAMALDRALTLYGEPAHGGGAFPEFYFFDCQSCHRTISNDDPKWRPTAEANPGRSTPVGSPPFNDENMIMLSAAAKAVAPALAARFETDSAAFHTALAKDRAGSVRAGAQLAGTSRALADAFAAHSFGKAETLAIFDAVLSGQAKRYTDYAGASQAVMAADTLLNALIAQGGVDRAAAARVRPDLDRAYQAVRDPNAFHPAEARKALAAMADKVRALK